MKETLGQRISEILDAKGLTQKELAIRSSVTEAAISHYIKGDRFPRAIVLGRIAEALGTSSDYLLNGEASNFTEEVQHATRLIARNIDKMSNEEKLRIISILLGNDRGEVK